MLLYPQQPIFPLNGKYFPARSPQDIAAENALHKRMAAAYEDARKVWAENRERYALTGILSDAFPIGPSEPQKEVERFLVDYGWLPPRVDPVKEKEKSSVYEDSTPVPRIPRRNPLRRCLQLAIPQSRWNSTKSATTSVGTGPQSRAPFSPQKLWLSFRTSTTSLPGGFKSRSSLSSPLPLRPRRKKCVSLGSAPAALPVPIVLPVPPETAEESPPPTPPPTTYEAPSQHRRRIAARDCHRSPCNVYSQATSPTSFPISPQNKSSCDTTSHSLVPRLL
ncbi:hypothetical protein C8J57DRAFT_255732 [Mycena rebaudengoi]|nr:hypothetical protein C8J57DRAFT_255732 [Mycena rebaudengoi]